MTDTVKPRPHPDPPNPYRTSFLIWTSDSDAARHAGSLEPTWHWCVSGPRGFQSGCEVHAYEATQRAYAAYGVVKGDAEP